MTVTIGWWELAVGCAAIIGVNVLDTWWVDRTYWRKRFHEVLAQWTDASTDWMRQTTDRLERRWDHTDWEMLLEEAERFETMAAAMQGGDSVGGPRERWGQIAAMRTAGAYLRGAARDAKRLSEMAQSGPPNQPTPTSNDMETSDG